MKGRKVVDFLTVRPAFSQRNLTTLLLVGVFIAVYTLAGGKVTLQVPNIQASDQQFGAVAGPDGRPEGAANEDADRAARILGMKATADETARQNSVNARGKLFDPALDADPSDGKLDKSGLLGVDPREAEDKEAKLRKYEKHQPDSLAAIEERLKINRVAK